MKNWASSIHTVSYFCTIEFIFVISSKKKIIKKYFYNDIFFKKIIKKKKNDKVLKEKYLRIKKFKKMIKFVYQNTPKGTGDAVLKCQKLIKSKYFTLSSNGL